MSASKLLFLCPTSLIAQYQPPPEWLEGSYLKVFVHPNEYKPSRTIEGGEPYIHTAGGIFAPPRLMQYSFTASFVYGRMATLNLIELLATISGTSGYSQHSPVTVLDYVRPEAGHGSYTRRVGRIDGIAESGGAILNPMDGKLYQHGFELTFVETYKRPGY